MKNDHEFTGTLLGFDDFVSEYLRSTLSTRHWNAIPSPFSIDMVLDDVIE
jgi:small nuclear ribonucleoprotein (snRNP)-like protein